MTHLVNAEIDGVPFADEHIHDASEIMGLMLVLFLGGVESTAGLVGTLFKLLAENPEQREILRANPELIPDAVEEAIRIATPLQLVGRTTSREVTLHGVTIPAGGRVVLVYGAANRDERRFADPDRFDVTRGKQRHLGFGEGMHGCIGAPLARLEAKIALEEALPLMGDYTITDVPERYKTTPNMYVWEHLHLAFPVTEAAHRDPRGRVETAGHHTDTTVVTRELETEVRVAAKDERAEGVVALTLKTLDGAPLPEWAPGAHVDLVLGGGVPNRQYSLCGDVADRRCLPPRHPARRGRRRGFAARPRPAGRGRRRAGARAAQQLRARALAALPLHRGRHRHHADPADDRRGRGGGRRVAARLRRPHPRVHGVPRRAGGIRRPRDREPPGRDGPARPRDPARHPGARHARLLLRAGAAARRRRGRGARGGRRRALHLERFAARPMGAPVRAEAFDVELARSGLTLTVPPERSILDVVEAAGVGVLSSCAEGTCGTCETTVLDGRPDHRDSVLTAAEQGANSCMLICVSRSCTDRLVLDL